jgi:hypothetical protein
MIYLERKPSPALAGCVEMLWYACAPGVVHQRELVLPGGKIQFVISLAADHLTDCRPECDVAVAPALLVGARTSAELIATGDMKRLAGVVFRPGGLGPWLRERAELFLSSLFRLATCGPWKLGVIAYAIWKPRPRSRCRSWTRCFVSELRLGNDETMFAGR